MHLNQGHDRRACHNFFVCCIVLLHVFVVPSPTHSTKNAIQQKKQRNLGILFQPIIEPKMKVFAQLHTFPLKFEFRTSTIVKFPLIILESTTGKNVVQIVQNSEFYGLTEEQFFCKNTNY